MAFKFNLTDFDNLNKIGLTWPTSKSDSEPFKKNLDKLKKLRDAINNSSTDYYAVSKQNPNDQSGPGIFTVGAPFLNIFPKWMPGLKANDYVIGFIINQNVNGFDFSITFCDNHFKRKKIAAPPSILRYQWEVNTIIGMSDADLVKEIIGQCDANINKLVEEGVKNNVSACVNYPKSTPHASFTRPIPLNQILYGPPGTGKTYHTVEKALEILDPGFRSSVLTDPGLNDDNKFKELKKQFDNLKNQGQIVFTTFHQSMSYEDFVEGIKPKTIKKKIEYDVTPGIFKELCDTAEKEPDKKYVLIIDEINRGNVSQIFGELITLLEEDKRIGKKFELKVRLPYSPNEDFGVPPNIYIIGTMNTADRSVEALDTALRRRFSFVEMMPTPDKVDEVVGGVRLREVFKAVNQRIAVLKDREHQIGHSYFMKCETLEDIKAMFKNEIIPLLQEYFYGNYENILRVLGEGFVEEVKEQVVFAGNKGYDGNFQTRYKLKDIVSMSDEDFKKAIIAMLPPSANEN